MKLDLSPLLRNFPGTAGIVFHDLDHGTRIEHNPHEPFNAASLIKLPVLDAFWLACARGEIDPAEQLEIQPAMHVPGFGILRTMAAGHRLSWQELAMLMISLSDNTATNLLIDKLGKPLINARIQALGMIGSKLDWKMFEDRPESLFNITTPADVALLLARFANSPADLGPFVGQPLHALDNQLCKNKFPLGLPRNTRLAHKTGEVTGVTHDAGILYAHERRIVMVVMTRDLADDRDGLALCRDVARSVYDTLT